MMALCRDGVEGGDNNDDLEEDNNGRDNYDEHDDIGGDDDDRSVFFQIDFHCCQCSYLPFFVILFVSLLMFTF